MQSWIIQKRCGKNATLVPCWSESKMVLPLRKEYGVLQNMKSRITMWCSNSSCPWGLSKDNRTTHYLAELLAITKGKEKQNKQTKCAWWSDFPLLWQNTWQKQLEDRRIYVDSQFQKFHSIVVERVWQRRTTHIMVTKTYKQCENA
jgi:hypothetical protein